jgi:glycosyltransferase involved in cell wall biosynthesis
VTVATLAGPQESFYPLHAHVRVAALDVMSDSASRAQAMGGNLRRLRAVQRVLRRVAPQAVIASQPETNVLTLLATRLLHRALCRVVVWEHTYAPLMPLTQPWPLARRLCYPLADAVATCSAGVAAWFRGWLPREKVAPIHNPVLVGDRRDDHRAADLARRIAGERWILAMGRLSQEKGFDLLLRAFARLRRQRQAGWKLGIIGEGPLREELEGNIAGLGLTGDASLLGPFANPMPVLRAGTIFVLSSRYEGFGIALAEAMACGLPAVAFRCPCGPDEIVRDGVDGLLVPPEDVEALATAVARLMGDEELRERLAVRATEASERFSAARFLDRWEDLIGSLVPPPRND